MKPLSLNQRFSKIIFRLFSAAALLGLLLASLLPASGLALAAGSNPQPKPQTPKFTNTVFIPFVSGVGPRLLVRKTVLPASTCSAVGTVRTCDLYAETGTMAQSSLPGAPAAGVPVWGYNSINAAVAAPGGPTLIANQGETLDIILHNVNLPVATSLMIAGMALIPDTIGVTTGSNKTYEIATGSLIPGTYLYQAGLVNDSNYDGPRQVALGLYGALIVRPVGVLLTGFVVGTRTDATATVASGSTLVNDTAVLSTDLGAAVSGAGIPSGTVIISVNPGVSFTMSQAAVVAYDAASAFNDESVVLLSEIDPAFNTAPTTFEMSTFAPKWWLINGQVYQTGTPVIGTDSGHTVLLRYINAGFQHHSMGVLGLHQTIIASDGNVKTNPSKVVAQTVPASGSLDTLVTIPASAPLGTKYALFEAAMHEDNNGTATAGVINFGGMMTFLQVSGPYTPPSGGPVASGVSISPNPTAGQVPVTLNATFTSAGSTVAAAEYFIDNLGAAGTGTALVATYGTGVVNGQVNLLPSALSLLSSGNHTFYVEGRDALGVWGSPASVVLNLDKTGPAVSSMSLTPNLDNGTADVQLQATGSDTATGGQNVTAAEFFIDSQPADTVRGTAISMPLPATDVSLTATIPAATVLAMTEGNHVVAVRAQDALGNWGAFGTINLKVDKSAPSTSNVSATPNPNNGTLGVQISSGGAFYVRIDATVNDVSSGNSNIAAAEYFFDTVGANGTGGAMIPSDGSYNSPIEAAYGAVELIHIAALSTGNHTIYVHGEDAAGNWGTFSTTVFVVDRTAPTAVSIARVGTTPTNASSVQFLVTFSEAVTGVSTSNFALAPTTFAGASITSVTGSGATRTVTVATGTGNGNLGLNLTSAANITDLAGNAMASTGLPLVGQVYVIDKVRPTVSSINRLNPNPTTAASVQFRVTFSESVTGGAPSNFSLTVTGTITGASITSVSVGPGNTRTVTVSTGTGTGTIGLVMSNSTGVTDLAGNSVNGLPFNTGQTYTKN